MPTSYDLDERLKQFWLEGRDKAQASAIIQEALSTRPQSAKQARLALQVMSEYEDELSPRLQGLIGEFREYLELLRLRLAQVDAIGNADTEPTAALFEVLGDASEGIELSGFDPVKLRQARVGASSRADAAAALLQAFGWGRLPEDVAQELKRAIDELQDEQRHYQSYGLFVADERGFALGLQVKLTDSGVHHCAARVDDVMLQQAEIALREALGDQGADWDAQWPFPYEGQSIGLGLYVGALVAKQQLAPDALTAATGRLDVGGHVRGVAGIAAKLEAAQESGIRRVVLPEENRVEAQAAPAGTDLELIFVDRASAVRAKLLDTSSGRTELGFEGSVRLARNLLPLYGLALEDERPIEHGYRLDVSDGRTGAILNVYSGRRGSVVVGGSRGSARRAAEQLVADHFKSEQPTAQPNETYRIPPARQAEAKRLLLESGAASSTRRANTRPGGCGSRMAPRRQQSSSTPATSACYKGSRRPTTRRPQQSGGRSRASAELAAIRTTRVGRAPRARGARPVHHQSFPMSRISGPTNPARATTSGRSSARLFSSRRSSVPS